MDRMCSWISGAKRRRAMTWVTLARVMSLAAGDIGLAGDLARVELGLPVHGFLEEPACQDALHLR
jgi:hypothetical protein